MLRPKTIKPPKPYRPPVQAPVGAVMAPAPGSRIGATPATPATPPRPFDAAYEQQVGLNTRTHNDTNVGLDQQTSATKRAYGLDDPTDPFSRAVLLREMYQNRGRGTTNSMAARGQLYSGANQNAHDQLARSELQDTDALRKGQDEVLAEIARRRAAAASGLEQGNLDAGQAARDRALAVPVDPATVPAKKKKQIKPRRR